MDPLLIEAVRALSARGYTIALDDFVYHEHLRPLVEVAHIVKIDVLALARSALTEHVTVLRRHGVKLLAEKVETQDDFRLCQDLGFDYFQGYFLCRPKVVQGQRAPANRLALLRLLARLQHPDIDARELAEIIGQDVSLSYRLLRVINSASHYLPREIDSINQAVVLLGVGFITKLASVIVLSGIDDKPNELVVTALVRARMCEQLASSMATEGQDAFFLVGLFSTLEALLELPMRDIVQQLPLPDDVARALLESRGLLGIVLLCVLAYERGDWDAVRCPGLEAEAIRTAYLDAVAWTAEMSPSLSA